MKTLKKISIIVFAIVLTGLMPSVNAYAMAASAGSYVTGDNNYRQPIPDCYVVTKTVNNIGDFEDPNPERKISTMTNPEDLFIDKDDNIYIVDTGNKRVIKMNSEYETVAIFYSPDEKAFNQPQGIFVDDDGDIYVADSENHRIVHMDKDGALVEIFYSPESDLDTGETFSPYKILVTETGYIYVVRGEKIITIDGNGIYRGSYGQTNIGFSLSDLLTRMFASERRKLFAEKRLASSYLNITLGDDGMIYATSREREEGEIKKLNSIGTNIFRKYKTVGNSIRNPFTDLKNKIFKATVAGQSFKFGEYFNDDGMYIEPVFADICVDSNGIVSVVEEYNKRVYQYDQSGRMLVAFGGSGDKKGSFTRPVALDVDSKGNIIVLDKQKGNFQVFSPTEFILNVHAATSAYNEGRYQESYDLWKKVLATDENYDLAHVGIARALYKQEKYKEAMAEAKLVKDRDLYSTAFDEYKYIVLREYFVPIIVIAVAIIFAVIFLVAFFAEKAKVGYWEFLRNKSEKMSFGAGVMYMFNVILHPVDCMEGIKNNRDRLNRAVPIFIFALAYVVRITYLYVVHFPLAEMETENINLGFEFVKLLIVPITWIPASFMATSISGGESKVKEITFACASSMIPYIVINIPLMFLSNLMSKTQKTWYGIFGTLATFGMIFILFVAMNVLNRYSFWKTVGMMLITAFLMVVSWFVLLLCYVLGGRIIEFFVSIAEEFKLNFL